MKKIIWKILDSIISIIEKYEDYKYWYHINLDTWKHQIWNYVLK